MRSSDGATAEGKANAMTWPALFGVFLLCHLVGDFLVQTDWQASHKEHGFGANRGSRRALALHGFTYTLVFVPAFVWVAGTAGPLATVGVAALVGVPHVIVDDGGFVSAWVRRVKHVQGPPTTVVHVGVDQTFHLLALAAVALAVTG
ncbi:MAG TPA: DUF3307 domain-containing protein [Solirubrobacteraceae bacterium]|jgi:hypothetical protein